MKRTFKKLITMSLAAIMAVSAMSISAFAADSENKYEENGVTYTYEETEGGVAITCIDEGENTSVVIPSQINGKDVVELKSSGKYDIGYTKLTVPGTVKKISQGAFGPSGGKLHDLILSEGVEILEDYAFEYNRYLRNISLPSTLKEIGAQCFTETPIKEITIPDGVSYIGDGAFSDCRNLETVNWDMTADKIGGKIFSGTKWLKNQDSEFLLLNNGTVLNSYTGNGKTATIPDGVTEISAGAFADASPESLTLTGSIKTVKNIYGFKGKEITVEDGVEIIGERAFANCDNLERVNLPDSLRKISKEAFAYCKSLKNINLPKNLEYIGYNAFLNCPMKELTIPESVQSLDELGAPVEKVIFLGKPQMRSWIFKKELKYVEGFTENDVAENWLAFMRTEFAENYKFKEHSFIINDGILQYYAGNDTEIEIPEGVKEIRAEVFTDKPITKVTLPSTLKKIGSRAFLNTDIEEIVIPKSVEEIKGSAFSECKNLKKVVFEPSNHSISVADTAFRNSPVSDLSLPENVKLTSSIQRTSYDEEPENSPQPTAKPTSTAKPTASAKPTATSAPTTEPKQSKLEVKSGEEIKISVDGKAVSFLDAKPFIDENDRTQVPVRAVAEMLNAKVDWDDTTQTVTITQDGKIVKIVIGNDTITVDGKMVKMDTKAVISEERTYIPVRFAAEALGMTVEWVNG